MLPRKAKAISTTANTGGAGGTREKKKKNTIRASQTERKDRAGANFKIPLAKTEPAGWSRLNNISYLLRAPEPPPDVLRL